MEESQGTTSFDYVSDPAAPSGFESGTGSDIGSVHDPQPDDPSAHPHHPTNPSTSLMVYEPPTSSWTLCRSLAINLLLPFVNGLMLGFGELFAHEAAFWLGWGGTKVGFAWFSLFSLIFLLGELHC